MELENLLFLLLEALEILENSLKVGVIVLEELTECAEEVQNAFGQQFIAV